MKIRETELFQEISKLPVIDTHEHLPWNEQWWANDGNDVLSEYLIHYLSSDIISSGMPRGEFNKVVDKSGDINERWKIVEPYWEACRYTGYARALDISAKGIYGVDGINAGTIEQLNSLFRENKKVGHYKRVLGDLCNIKMSLMDVWSYDVEGDYPNFKNLWQPTSHVLAHKDIFENIKNRHGIEVRCLDDWLDAMETELDRMLQKYGVRIIKTAIAYSRSLYFEKVSYSDAKGDFAYAISRMDESDSVEFSRELQDYIMHHAMKLANERNLTVQVHTGLLEGNCNTLANSDPTLLNNLFIEYPNVDFDLFHISYPFQAKAAALCKMFPNVFIDMCWAHIISPAAAVGALDNFLDAVPYNKISGFGGDYCFVDGVYGHLQMARENIARTLQNKVNDGAIGFDAAVRIAKALLYDNPNRIFKLNM